ncbi:MAG: thioesterase family protein [Spirochaetaceae bacterium]|nr:thioesterase family protein [Spirochaetaceae bacterium]
MDIRPGLSAEKIIIVGPEHVAAHLGSGGVPVYATPSMVLHIEETSRMAVEPLLDAGLSTVGASIQVEHLAPTPPGMKVRIRSELVEVNGRLLTFNVEVWDEVEKVGSARHVRAIIDLQRFSDKVARKIAKAAAEKQKSGGMSHDA